MPPLSRSSRSVTSGQSSGGTSSHRSSSRAPSASRSSRDTSPHRGSSRAPSVSRSSRDTSPRRSSGGTSSHRSSSRAPSVSRSSAVTSSDRGSATPSVSQSSAVTSSSRSSSRAPSVSRSSGGTPSHRSSSRPPSASRISAVTSSSVTSSRAPSTSRSSAVTSSDRGSRDTSSGRSSSSRVSSASGSSEATLRAESVLPDRTRLSTISEWIEDGPMRADAIVPRPATDYDPEPSRSSGTCLACSRNQPRVSLSTEPHRRNWLPANVARLILDRIRELDAQGRRVVRVEAARQDTQCCCGRCLVFCFNTWCPGCMEDLETLHIPYWVLLAMDDFGSCESRSSRYGDGGSRIESTTGSSRYGSSGSRLGSVSGGSCVGSETSCSLLRPE
ncbi:uncharacterized protein F5Z01DRAFT_173857 [Emericellopsis atlantica]|uniref:Uncharacterized protein n=1 Tax=Emericellopsis atlantica TaxID=2614577 RepID=A0A9P7ZJB9_9HYPO|nr:uncharacterized protein F5Z01DRAFT_173857 [Emericellopsis atlantica]KAG9253075.1 hypothetical protein F5Z01DRAFT_173857 [Emericellopsis atlantica]